jgi:hypothetical protein
MSLGTITVKDEAGLEPSAPTFKTLLQFTGDAAYPTGGTPTFSALVTAAVKRGAGAGGGTVDILEASGQDCGGYIVTYEKTADKLKVWTTPSGGGPLIEVTNATNLGSVTFNVLVTYQ